MLIEKTKSLTDANRNFTRMIKEVDDNGIMVLTRAGNPEYVVIRYDEYLMMKGNDGVIPEILKGILSGGMWVKLHDKYKEMFIRDGDKSQYQYFAKLTLNQGGRLFITFIKNGELSYATFEPSKNVIIGNGDHLELKTYGAPTDSVDESMKAHLSERIYRKCCMLDEDDTRSISEIVDELNDSRLPDVDYYTCS